ncbi:hypothetical protein FRB94_011205 [Tulasnella sp. JGI-2019a]|nr:hypothetical protein FRB94_011205 [Tulasnella sp. JGI-2019a]
MLNQGAIVLPTPNALHHPALLVYDILLDIFFHLDQFGLYRSGCKGSLLSAGLVCRAWYDPAMDVLWAERVFLSRLLALLSSLEIPPGCDTATASCEPASPLAMPLNVGRPHAGILESDGSSCEPFRRPIPQCWSRFRSYAYRVKSAVLDDRLFDPTFVSSTNPDPSQPLLPNVRQLILEPQDIRQALVWMHSMVERLNFTQRQGVNMSDFVVGTARLCPNLTELNLSWGTNVMAMEPINGLRRLRIVSLHGCDMTAVLLELAKLPSVESLSLSLLPDLPSRWPWSLIEPFPKLKKLRMSAVNGSMATFIRILATGGSYLKELNIGRNVHMEDLQTSICAIGVHRYLERLIIHSCQGSTTLSLPILRNIFPCDSLTTLSLHVDGDILMVDEDFIVLGIGLPRIVDFSLQTLKSRTKFTLQALSIAVKSWPSLKTLRLQINLDGAVPPEKHTAPHRQLHTLHLPYCIISTKPVQVAWFIAGLSDLDGFQLLCDECKFWPLVKELLPELRRARREARTRAHETRVSESD